MKTLRSSTTWFAPLFFFLLALFITGCSKDDDVTPTNGNVGSVVSKTIGSSGGEIALDSLSISIPPGAFSEEHKIELSVSDKQHPFKEQEVTSLYQVSGIPVFSASINIVLKYDGMLEEDSYIAYGIEQDLEEPDTTDIFFDLLGCQDSSGYLVGKLQPAGQNNGTKSESYNGQGRQDGSAKKKNRFIKGVTRYKTKIIKSSYSPFLIFHPVSMDMDHLVDYLEINYLVFDTWMKPSSFELFIIPEKVGVFDTRYFSSNYKTPSFVYVHKSESLAHESHFQYRIYNIHFNERKLNVEMGHAFYYAFQEYIYVGNLQPDWFSDAAAVWMEEKFYAPLGTIEDYVPEDLSGEELIPFRDWGRYSFGMVPVIKYLVEENGEKIIIEYHKEIFNDKSVYEALAQVTNKPLEKWMPDFFKNYMEGNIYGVSGDKFVAGIEGQYDLPYEGTQKYYTEEYDDLSAKIFQFNTANLVMNDNAQVGFKVESWQIDTKYINVLIFSLDKDNNKIEFISDNISNPTIVSDLKGLKEENKDLLALVVNSYKDINKTTNQSEIQLIVEFKESVQLTYTRFSVVCRHINIEYIRNDGDTERYEDRALAISMPLNLIGQFTGDEFVAEWNFNEGAYTFSGSVLAYVEEKGNDLILTTYDITYDKVSSPSKDLRRMAGGDITLVQRGHSDFELAGTVTGSDINKALDINDLVRTNIYYHEDRSEMDKSRKLKKVELTSESELEVIFSDPD